MSSIRRHFELTRVFLTGSSGFIGRNFYKLYKDVYDITLCDIANGQDILYGDTVPNWQSKLSPYDVVVHLAAKAGVRRSHLIPDEYWETNVEGSKKIFKACDSFGFTIPCIYASSSSIYEWWQSPYATTKKVVEQIAPESSLGLRFHTVYGDDSRPDMLYDQLLNKSDKLTYLTEHTRDFTHVEDVCSAIAICIDNFRSLKQYRAIDVGNGTPVSVKEMADHVWPDNNLPYKEVSGEREHTCADPTILKQFGWSAKHNILS